jgi:TolB-like protein/DNA-binding CsgD family transcriptional regulator/Flp pilus assembly protein TadD
MGAGGDGKQLKHLTPREAEVLELMTRGLRNAEIGKALRISPKTVKNHVAAILGKLEVTNRTEAVGLGTIELNARDSSGDVGGADRPPAIAVLPLACAQSDALARRWADGIVDDLITRLGRCWYPVIARCSSFRVTHAESVDARAIGQALGASYLVEGSLSHHERRMHLNVRLVEAGSGHVIWSDLYDRKLSDVFDVLNELSFAVMEGVYRATIRHVARTIEETPRLPLKSWQIGIRGMWHFWRGSAQHNVLARTLFTEALEAEPEQRLALYGIALTHQRELYEQWAPDPNASVQALAVISARFLQAWPDDPWALLMASYTELYRGEREGAIERVRQTLEREPSLVGGRSLYGQLLAMDGQTESAVTELEKALLLSPRTPDRWVYECVMALAYFAGSSYQQAVAWGLRAAASSRAGAMAYGVLASSYYHLGERENAKHAANRFSQLAPSFSNARFRPMIASTRKEISARYLAGLNGAATC